MDRATVHRRRWRILVVLSLCLIIIGLDNLIIALALPKIQSQLNASISDLQWTADAYSVLFGGLLLLAGGLADRFGRKLMLMLGLAGFGAFSLGAAFSTSPGMLIGFRAMIGLSAALIMPATLAIITDVFPPEEQTKAISIWAMAAGIGVPLGPLLGGVLLDHFWWGSIFLINAPVVAVALIASLVLIPESRDQGHPGLDMGGAALSVVGLVVLVYGLVAGPQYGWRDARSLGGLIGGAVLLAAFALYEHRAAGPMLDITLFRNPQFGGSSWAIVCVGFTLFGTLFMLTQLFQFVRAYQPLSAGLRLLAVCVLIVTAGTAPRLVKRLGLKITIATGLAGIAAGAYTLSNASTISDFRAMLALGLVGFGMGLVMPVAGDAILVATPSDRSGSGSAVADTSLQVGGALGIAVLGSVMTTEYRHSLPALSGLSGPAREAVRNSVGSANVAAAHLGAAGRPIIAISNHAFMTGVSDATLISVVAAGIGAVAAALVLPMRAAGPTLNATQAGIGHPPQTISAAAEPESP